MFDVRHFANGSAKVRHLIHNSQFAGNKFLYFLCFSKTYVFSLGLGFGTNKSPRCAVHLGDFVVIPLSFSEGEWVRTFYSSSQASQESSSFVSAFSPLTVSSLIGRLSASI